MQEILFLKPIFQERIWGGSRLREAFDYSIPSEKTGECWAISAHRNGDCQVMNGDLKGQVLSKVYKDYPELFNYCESEGFPLLTKLLDASADLSVQVHPDDEYAKTYENDLGKTECWYIIDCEEDAEIIYGHHAKSKAELVRMVEEGQWDNLLRRVKIKPGDFFYLPSGTIHALCEGTLVLETQQSSDTTYRVYDYDRLDDEGNKRELHIDKAIEVATIPHKDYEIHPSVKENKASKFITYVETEFFTVDKWIINNEVTLVNDKFRLVSVLNGSGTVNGQEIKKADHFIVSGTCESITLSGDLGLMVSYL